MSQYTPTTGIILQIEWQTTGNPHQDGCGLTLTLNTMDQGLIRMHLDGFTYVFNNRQLNVGDQVTCFYSTFAPVPLIYPPTYRAVVIVHTSASSYAMLDVFTRQSNGRGLINTENSLQLNISGLTPRLLPNGQLFGGELSGKLLLVIYSSTTRSIPAQTAPDQIIVFCNSPDGSWSNNAPGTSSGAVSGNPCSCQNRNTR